jgi:hypothetical protein
MAAPAVDVTEELLRQAFQAARRPNWPGSFEEAMQDAIYSRLVRINAVRLARGQSIGSSTVIRRPAVKAPGLDRTPPRTTPQLPLPLDRKRAASGERDDD